MSDEPDPDRLAALARKLAEARRARAPAPKAEEHFSQASQGWRMVIELVSGLGIGFGIGYGLDGLFGTMPLFLVLFMLLGFAAGVQVMLRTAREIAEREAGSGQDGGRGGGQTRRGREKGTRRGERSCRAKAWHSTRWTSSSCIRCSAARRSTGTPRPTPRCGWR